MALSDSCHAFLDSMKDAAAELGRAAHEYSAPDSPLRYLTEIDALRHACIAVADAPFYEPEPLIRVVRLAHSIMSYHDSVPFLDASRRAEMMKLVKALQKELDPDEAAAVPEVVERVLKETPDTASAAKRLKAMLSKLGKPTYDVAIKIIGDIGSATVKKLLGL